MPSDLTARDRQDALVGFLRARGSATAGEVAAQFGVTQRTVHRDLAALASRNVLVSRERGRGGGLRLDAQHSATDVRLVVPEIVGLALAVAVARPSTTAPFGRAANAALHKLLASLPAPRARGLSALLRRIYVGSAASTAVATTLGAPAPHVLEALEQAFRERRTLGIDYHDRHGAPSRREIEPQGLLVQQPAWYVLAYDPGRAAPRMFRLDRIRRAEITARRFTPCAPTLLGELLREVGELRTLHAPES